MPEQSDKLIQSIIITTLLVIISIFAFLIGMNSNINSKINTLQKSVDALKPAKPEKTTSTETLTTAFPISDQTQPEKTALLETQATNQTSFTPCVDEMWKSLTASNKLYACKSAIPAKECLKLEEKNYLANQALTECFSRLCPNSNGQIPPCQQENQRTLETTLKELQCFSICEKPLCQGETTCDHTTLSRKAAEEVYHVCLRLACPNWHPSAP